MLTSLHIENIAVIKNIDIEFNEGFTVLTGETGAGKSIIIDSINLLLGGRPGKDLIRTGESSAMVSALFSNISVSNVKLLNEMGVQLSEDDNSLMLQRNISADGKSSTRLNGRTIPVALQKELGKSLINIHGQHDNQALLQPSRHIHFLDSYADVNEILPEYEKYYSLMNDTTKKISDLSRNEQEKARMIELLKYQISDIDSVKLKDNEDEKLTNESNRIQNFEKILKQVKLVYRALYRMEKGLSAFDLMTRASDALAQIADVLPEANQFIEKLTEFKYEIEDIAETVRDAAADDYDDPTAELNRIESRLDEIFRLKRKYGSTIKEILEFKEKAEKELEEIELSDVKIIELKAKYSEYKSKAKEYSDKLTKIRTQAARILEVKIMEELAFLEMGKVKFSVQIKPIVESSGGVRYASRGVDDIEFLISTNPGEPLKPLSKIASGGELSRIMLAMKSVFAGRENTETIIFDEIDTGISGKTSQKIGVKLRQTSDSCQVICVTHSAQIASTAQNHLFINKTENDGRVETIVTPLTENDRVNEVARIMGGLEITTKLLDTAREMIENNNNI
jgi:DNA repair protein RecN